MLPGVKISFANGALAQVEAMADGCLGLIGIGAVEVDGEGNFKLGEAYILKKLADLEELGVTAENNPNLYRNIKDFYSEGKDGTEVWLMGFPASSTFANILDKDNASGAKSLLLASNGKIRGLLSFKTPAEGYVSDNKSGVDSDVIAALPKAQALGVWATEEFRAPIFTLIEGYDYNDKPNDLSDLKTMECNRVGIVIGDTMPNSKNAAMGIVAGRIATSPVHRKIGRVKSGALTPLTMYIGSKLVEVADAETIHDKGFITFRTFVGKTGYFIAGDNLATKVGDDYRTLANRRVIDKAYRIVYNEMVEELNNEVPVASDGNLSPSWCVSVKGGVEQALISNMTDNGNLGNDPENPSDTGVECNIPYKQKIHQTSTLKVGFRVKPYGYAEFIEGELGFKTK